MSFVNTWPNQWVWSMSKSSKHTVNYVPSAVYITIRLQFNMASMIRYYAMCTKRIILRGMNGMQADLRCWQKNEKWKRNGVLLRRFLRVKRTHPEVTDSCAKILGRLCCWHPWQCGYLLLQIVCRYRGTISPRKSSPSIFIAHSFSLELMCASYMLHLFGYVEAYFAALKILG
jgi:hypothetical protein